MTEQEWLTAIDPPAMLEFLRGKASDRKLRFFALACCLKVLHPADDKRCLQAARVIEAFADGKVTKDKLNEAKSMVNAMLDESPDAYDAVSEAAYTTYFAASADLGDPRILINAIRHAAESAAFAGEESPEADTWVAAWLSNRKEANAEENLKIAAHRAQRDHALHQAYNEQCGFLRCIFGNPFRPAACDPAWRTATVVALAAAIYDERAFDRLPILADALEDAGCTNADMLKHCREPGDHVRGCWCVDLLLGKS